jgi:uncharacterized RDD family membrane protein YckC
VALEAVAKLVVEPIRNELLSYALKLAQHTHSGIVKIEAENLEFVGFWARVRGSPIDTFVILIITAPLLMMVYGRNYFALTGALQGPADFLISYLLPAVIVIVFWSTKNATPGKTAIGAKIVDARTGEAPGLGQYIGRYFGYF